MVWVRDGDQSPSTLGKRAASQAGDSVLGHDVVDGVLQGGDD
jgi:hypothetical protein